VHGRHRVAELIQLAVLGHIEVRIAGKVGCHRVATELGDHLCVAVVRDASGDVLKEEGRDRRVVRHLLGEVERVARLALERLAEDRVQRLLAKLLPARQEGAASATVAAAATAAAHDDR